MPCNYIVMDCGYDIYLCNLKLVVCSGILVKICTVVSICISKWISVVLCIGVSFHLRVQSYQAVAKFVFSLHVIIIQRLFFHAVWLNISPKVKKNIKEAVSNNRAC